jgi:hypothetical protein
MTFRRKCVWILSAAMALTPIARAEAQPIVRAVGFPSANAAGWNNSVVHVIFFCAPVQPCPERQRIQSNGRDQLIAGSIKEADGRETRASVSLNIDTLAPRVQIVTPAEGLSTAAVSIQILARAADELSGVTSATCAGVQASFDERGDIRCTVALLPGVNDVVVEATDAAGNSGSIGVRVTRTGSTSKLRVAPEALSVLAGQPRTLQVMDEYGPVLDVIWRVDNPWIARMADDTNVLTPLRAGKAVVTAMHGGASASAVVTVHAGDRLPAGTTKWQNGRGVKVIQTPPTAGTPGVDPPLLTTYEPAGRQPMLFATDFETGEDLWSEAPPMSAGEKAASLYAQRIGGALIVIDRRDGLGSALVRGGPSPVGTPWRYQSSGRLGHALVQDGGGQIAVIETRSDGFPEFVSFDGRTGTVIIRSAFVPGIDAALNVGCVSGAHGARFVPARIGDPRIYPGVVVFEKVTANDLQDYGVCGVVSGRLRRHVELMMARPDGMTVQPLATYEFAAGTSPPEITVLPVASDGHGGFLAPWIVAAVEGTPAKHRLTHITADGLADEWTMPVVGEIVRWNDLASMTDGTTLITFDSMTGAIKWTRVFPGGARILPGPRSGTLYVVTRSKEILDEFGRIVK